MDDKRHHLGDFTLAQLPTAVGALLAHWTKPILLLEGQVGAGKTTFVKALCKELGVEDEVSSPTFALVNEYVRAQGGSIYHFDLYRLTDVQEALDFGIEEYLYSGAPCLIEWPEKIRTLLDEPHQLLQIEILSPEQRSFYISNHHE